MSIMSLPASAGASRGWTVLSTCWQQLARAAASRAEDRKIARAICQLSQFDEYELSDMGLSRSDLTPEGLTQAAARRRRQQAAIDAEMSARK